MERTTNGVVSIDLCLYTIRTRHAEIERRSPANGKTATRLKRECSELCVHENEMEFRIECCFLFLQPYSIHWIEVPILTSLESVLIKWMHLNFVNDVVAVITFNPMTFTVSEFRHKITITMCIVRSGFAFEFRVWLNCCSRPCATLAWLSSLKKKKTSNWIWTSYRVSSVCNQGTFWTSIRAIGEYSTRRAWKSAERTSDGRNDQKCSPCISNVFENSKNFNAVGMYEYIPVVWEQHEWLHSACAACRHTTVKFIEFHRRLMLSSISNCVAVDNELRRL